MTINYVNTPTFEGDNWASLFAAYKHAFPAGTTQTAFAQAVCKANGVSYTTKAIENWIYGISGKRMPLVANNTPAMYGGPVNVGWAYFGEGNVIKLPDVQRFAPGVVKPTTPPVMAVKDNKVLWWSALAAGGIWLLAVVGGGKKKPKGKE